MISKRRLLRIILVAFASATFTSLALLLVTGFLNISFHGGIVSAVTGAVTAAYTASSRENSQ